MGQMVNEINSQKTINSPNLLNRLMEAAKSRNSLAHNYFYERKRQMCSIDGNKEMISELQLKAGYFSDLHKELTVILQEWMNQKEKI